MKIILLLLALTNSCLFVQSQSVQIKGRLLSKLDSLPISGAHVYFSSFENIGTLTDEEGYFSLQYIDTIKNANMIFSHIAYVKIATSNNKKNSIYYLTPNSILLDEIILEVKEDSVLKIIQNAFNRIKKNYPTKVHYMKGFYRYLSIQDSSYNMLMEAALAIQDNGYNTNTNKVKIKVEQLRKSDDFGDNEMKFVLFGNLLGKLFSTNNQLYNTYLKNPIRKESEKMFYFNPQYFLLNNKLEIAGLLVDNQDTIIIIDYLKKTDIFTRSGQLYINRSDFSFRKITQKYNLNKEESKFEIEFQKINNKYYPLTISVVEPRRTSSKKQWQHHFLFFNDIVIKRKRVLKIKRKFAEDRGENLMTKDYIYNKAFWDSFNYPKKLPLEANIINNLESIGGKMQNQFKRNAINEK